MQDIIKIYNYYMLKLPENNKEIKLTYKISEYQFIKNQDKDYIKKLKKQKNKIKLIKGKDNKKFYYKMYSEKILTVEQKKKIIYAILKIKNDLNQTIEEQMLKKLHDIDCHKTTKDNLFDGVAKSLDILSDFLLAENDKDLYTNHKLNKLQSKEIPSTDVDYMNDKYRKNKQITKKQEDGWKNSKTYRMNMIFSYDKLKESLEDGVYWNNTQVNKTIEPNEKRDGIINKYEKYTYCWCNVDTENCFIFNGIEYKIDNIEQYKKRKLTTRDKHKEEYEMDKILAFEQYGKNYFFDMDIIRIPSNKIKVQILNN